MDSHLTQIVIIPAKNIKAAKLELQKNHTEVIAVKFFGWYLVDILIGLEGLHFRAHINQDKIIITDKSLGFSYLHDLLSKPQK
ncbi:hypothetical protein FK216_14995 [Moraxellaceae bacterium AER2_44_116]|nr:hypothetical protein [Moraxellaceae bacterium]TQC95002.1 hypothetical protein FK216_14995 [Moraxellaceae bacterium AER2_44_116]